jgi:hypothetical protein
MTVVRQSRCKGRPIVKGKGRLAFAQLQLLLEGLDLGPELEDFFFLQRKIRSVRD